MPEPAADARETPWQFSLLELLMAMSAIAAILAMHRSLGTLGLLAVTAPHSLVVGLFLAHQRRLAAERWSQAWGVLAGFLSMPLVLGSLVLTRQLTKDGYAIDFLPCLGVAVLGWGILRGLVLSNAMLVASLLLQLPPHRISPRKADHLAIVWVTIGSLAFPL
jgi:hypothetical protein